MMSFFQYSYITLQATTIFFKRLKKYIQHSHKKHMMILFIYTYVRFSTYIYLYSGKIYNVKIYNEHILMHVTENSHVVTRF